MLSPAALQEVLRLPLELIFTMRVGGKRGEGAVVKWVAQIEGSICCLGRRHSVGI